MRLTSTAGRAPMPAHAADVRRWFEAAVAEALPELYGTALRLTRDPADAEDLVAETVAKGWMKLGTLRARSSVRGWLGRILGNTFVSAYRARAARPTMEPLDESEDVASFSLFERVHQPFLLWWGTPEQDLLDKLLRSDLERAVDALPDAYRAVVVMVDLQGMSYQEVGEVLEVPLGTVRSRLARGRARLQKALWEHAVDAGLVAGSATPEGETR